MVVQIGRVERRKDDRRYSVLCMKLSLKRPSFSTAAESLVPIMFDRLVEFSDDPRTDPFRRACSAIGLPVIIMYELHPDE